MVAEELEPQTSALWQFVGPDGAAVEEVMELPLGSTPAQLNVVLNQVLRAAAATRKRARQTGKLSADSVEDDDDDDPDDGLRPYAFYLTADHQHAVSSTLAEALAALGDRDRRKGSDVRAEFGGTERTLALHFQPESRFYVRGVTRCAASVPGHAEAVLALSFSPDSTLLASASGDTTVRLWHAASRSPLATLSGHRNWVLTLAWAPVASSAVAQSHYLLASADKDGLVCIWRSGEEHCEKQESQRAASSFVARSSNAAAPRPTLLRGHRKWVTSLAWEPVFEEDDGGGGGDDDDGGGGPKVSERVASASKDGTVRIWRAAGGICERVLGGHTAAVTAVLWGASGALYSASQDRTIKVWDASSGAMVRSLDGHGHWVNTMALDNGLALRAPQVAASGRFAIADGAGSVRRRHKRSRLSASAAGVDESVLIGADEVLVSGSDDFTLHLWRPLRESKPVARMVGHQQLVNCVAFSADGEHIASASFDKSVRLWNAHTGAFLHTFRAHVGAVYGVAFSPDSRLLLSASRDATLKLWHVRGRKLKADLPGHSDEIYAIDWAPDGSHAASAGKDKLIKFWHH